MDDLGSLLRQTQKLQAPLQLIATTLSANFEASFSIKLHQGLRRHFIEQASKARALAGRHGLEAIMFVIG